MRSDEDRIYDLLLFLCFSSLGTNFVLLAIFVTKP